MNRGILDFQGKVQRGEAKLGEKKVEIIPPDPLGELGSGYAKINASTLPTPTPTSLKVQGR